MSLHGEFGLARSVQTMDLTPVFSQILAAHDSRPIQPHVFRLEHLDEFLKEAYRVVGHVAHTGGALTADSRTEGAYRRATRISAINPAELPLNCTCTPTETSHAGAKRQRLAGTRWQDEVP
jgi:hypothetical protein